MRYLIAALAMLGLSIPIVRAIRSPSTPAGPTPDEATDTGGPLTVSSWLDTFSNGAALVETFSTDTMNAIKSIWQPPAKYAARVQPYQAAIDAATAENGLPPGLLTRQLWQESRFNPAAVSPVGAKGLAQFMPATAAEMGVDVNDPVSSINGMARYMKQLFNRFGTWEEALAAYNWGQGNVSKKGMGNLPSETQNYVQQISADIGLNS